MDEQIQQTTELVMALIAAYGLHVIGAILILVFGWIASGWAKKAIIRGLARTDRIDPMLRGSISSFARYGIIAFTLLAVLSKFGIQTASLIAVMGALGLAIGLALQGTLGHIAAGVMILIFRPFKVGDYVEVAGHGGTVKMVTLFTTKLATPDNVQILVPNGQIWDTAVRNYSHYDTRRLDMGLGIAYEDNIDRAIAAVNDLIAADPHAMAEPESLVVVGELGASSVDLTIRIWCARGNYWGLRFDLTKALKKRMDAEGISIPYPQRDVHLIPAEPSD
jgi:small conductance mechanosensitive channel